MPRAYSIGHLYLGVYTLDPVDTGTLKLSISSPPHFSKGYRALENMSGAYSSGELRQKHNPPVWTSLVGLRLDFVSHEYGSCKAQRSFVVIHPDYFVATGPKA